MCDCGSELFKNVFHLDYTDKAVNNFVCAKCNNQVGTESYRSDEAKAYWESGGLCYEGGMTILTVMLLIMGLFVLYVVVSQ